MPQFSSNGLCSYGLSLTSEEERQFGKVFLKHARENLNLINDRVITSYVTSVGKKIVAQLPSQPFEYHFYVVQEEAYNAFAAPAGHVFVNSGLLSAMENENELAGILSHEIAHVACRHISQRIEHSQKIGLATIAGVLAGVFMGGGAATGAITTGSIAAGESLALAYSRENEAEADQVGIKYLVKAGYNAKGLLSILNKIRANNAFGPKEIPTYLTTHPAIDDRLIYIDTQLQVHPEWQKASIKTDGYIFEKVRTKAIALYGRPDTALSRFQWLVSKEPENPLAQYGLALSLGRAGKNAQTLNTMKKAVTCNPADPDILLDLGKLYFSAGDYQQARTLLKGAMAFRPDDPEGYYLLGKSLFETGDFHEAIETLQKLLLLDPECMEGYYYLGTAYGKIDCHAEAHYYLGIFFERKGDDKNAVFHYKKALKLFAANTARITEIKERLEILQKEKD
ncbi:MAG: M48 family metalloprotease [Pseudomonadota bacterium]